MSSHAVYNLLRSRSGSLTKTAEHHKYTAVSSDHLHNLVYHTLQTAPFNPHHSSLFLTKIINMFNYVEYAQEK